MTDELKKWVVPYTRIPTNYNDTHRARVLAETAELARELVIDQLGDNGPGLTNYMVGPAAEYVPVKSAGRVEVMMGGDK
jgi:hypothetical protein